MGAIITAFLVMGLYFGGGSLLGYGFGSQRGPVDGLRVVFGTAMGTLATFILAFTTLRCF